MLFGFIILVLAQCKGEPTLSFPDERYIAETVPRTNGSIVFENGQKFMAEKIENGARQAVVRQPEGLLHVQSQARKLTYFPVVIPYQYPVFYHPILPVQGPILGFPSLNQDSPHFPTENVTPINSGPTQNPNKHEVYGADSTNCRCLPLETCLNKRGVVPSVRVVTNPPMESACPPNEVYCCTNVMKLGCGIPNIIPGVKPSAGQAHLGQYPWTALLLTSDNLYVGGGVLVESMHVLTVAHNLNKLGNLQGLKVRLGDWDLTNEFEPVRFAEFKVRKVTFHPQFDAATLRNDIAVLTLALPVATFTEPYPQINSICLPDSSDAFIGLRCKVAGWGKDQFKGKYQPILKEVDVPVLSPNECQEKMRATQLGNSFILDTNSFLCAGGEPGKDACTGDGGNALACPKNGKFYAAGLTAAGIECGNPNVPGLYVNLVNYIPWIRSVMHQIEDLSVIPRFNHLPKR